MAQQLIPRRQQQQQQHLIDLERVPERRWITPSRPPRPLSTGTSDDGADNWQVVLRSQQGVVVLYNKAERSLHVDDGSGGPLRYLHGSVGHGDSVTTTSSSFESATTSIEVDNDHDNFASSAPGSSNCPLCHRPFTASSSSPNARRTGRSGEAAAAINKRLKRPAPPLLLSSAGEHHAAALPHGGFQRSNNYFHILSESHQGSPNVLSPEPSRPGTPVFGEVIMDGNDGSIGRGGTNGLNESSFLEGYYRRFFVEIAQLGRGMTGSVFLCQHVLNGNPLGYFACKKIPVRAGSRRDGRSMW